MLLSEEKSITDTFYLSGGTALAEFYLRHRYSEDLDFFSEQEFNPEAITVLLKRLQSAMNVDSFTFETSFNRNLFFLRSGADDIKTEFTYFPFARIEKGQTLGALLIDSLLDIAVNKVFTIYQKPRARDFIDLFFIMRARKEFTLPELIQKAQIKFDHHLDPLQMSAQLLKSKEAEDIPRFLMISLKDSEWRDFCRAEAKKLAESVLSK